MKEIVVYKFCTAKLICINLLVSCTLDLCNESEDINNIERMIDSK